MTAYERTMRDTIELLEIVTTDKDRNILSAEDRAKAIKLLSEYRKMLSDVERAKK